jgi:hypothetical protein
MYIINQLSTPENAAKMFHSSMIVIEQCNFGSIVGTSFFVWDSRCVKPSDFISETVAIFKVKPRLSVNQSGQLQVA